MPQSRIPAVSRVQEVFEQVLALPEFRDLTASPLARVLEAVVDALGRFFARWLPTVEDSQIRLVSWLLLVGTAIAGAYLGVRWIAGRLPGTPRRGRDTSSRPAPRDAAGWGKWARAEALAGRLSEAATGLYQAVILHLEARGALRYGEWKTPGDYALEVSTEEALHAPFRSFLGQFVEVAFGPEEPTPEALGSLFAGAERLGCPI